MPKTKALVTIFSCLLILAVMAQVASARSTEYVIVNDESPAVVLKRITYETNGNWDVLPTTLLTAKGDAKTSTGFFDSLSSAIRYNIVTGYSGALLGQLVMRSANPVVGPSSASCEVTGTTAYTCVAKTNPWNPDNKATITLISTPRAR